MSLCRFRRKICISLGAKTNCSDTFCLKGHHYVTLAYNRNDTTMSFSISATVAVAKVSLWPLFVPNEMRHYGHLWNKHQYFS